MFNLPTARSPLPKREISYRNLKALNLGAFCVDIQNSFIYSPEAGSPDDLVDLYSKTITYLLNKYVPVKTKVLPIRPFAPWYDGHIHEHKRHVRKCEKKWRETGLSVHREAFIMARNALTYKIKTIKIDYIHSNIKNSDGNHKSIFRCIDELLYKPKGNALPSNIPTDQLPDKFVHFFCQ